MIRTYTCILLLALIVLQVAPLGLTGPQLLVEDQGASILVDTGVARLLIGKVGARPVGWLVDGVELAANAGSRGAMGKSYPLYDWLPTQSWPGLIVSTEFKAEVTRPGPDVAAVRFTAEVPVTDVSGIPGRVRVVREYTFTQGKRAFTLRVTLVNLGDTPLNIQVTWEGARVGYTFAVTGVIGTSKDNDWQIWVDAGNLYTRNPDQRESWVRRRSPLIQVIGLYDPEEKGIIVARLHNITEAMWLEADVWGLEVRAELPSLQLQPNKPVSFLFTIYGGSPDYLDAEGFADLKARLLGWAPPSAPAPSLEERTPPPLPKPAGSVKYSIEKDSVLVDTGVAKMTLSLEGARPVGWLVDGVELAANAGSRGAMGKSYPLYDWLPTQSWPGLITFARFTPTVESYNGTVLVLRLETTVPFTTLSGEQTTLRVARRFTFYAGLYAFDEEVSIVNEGKVEMESKVVWDRTIGYTFAVTGVIGSSGDDDWQAWGDSAGIHLLSPREKIHYTWKTAPDLQWIGVLDLTENAGVIAYLVTPGSTVVWLEASTWGTEVRAEYPPFSLKPGESTRFRFRVYGGPLDKLGVYGYQELESRLAGALTQLAVSFNVTTDKLFYSPGDVVQLYVSAAYRRGVATAYLDYPGGRVQLELSAKPVARLLEVKAPDVQGIHTITVTLRLPDLEVSREVKIGVVNKASWGKPLKLVFVWHHHQGINMWPNGTFHGPWAFTHTHDDEFKPFYAGGAYLVQAEILSRYPAVKMVYHLSPSLLWQWDYAVKYGYYNLLTNRYVAPDSAEIRRVAEALRLYKELAARGQIEIFSDFFNHPIPGYVADTYPWGVEAMRLELDWGLQVTKRVLNVDTRGAWIPEMFFSEKLVPMLSERGVRYIVLDYETHYKGSDGQKKGIYTAYTFSQGGYSIIVLFRDTQLSNVIGFENRFPTPQDADSAARNFILAVASRRFADPSAEVVVVSADGENWMIFSPTVATTGVFFESLCKYLQEASDVVQTATVAEVVEELTRSGSLPRLTRIPTASWAGGSDVWTGKPEQKQQWEWINRGAAVLDSIKSKYGADSAVYRAALFAFFMMLNSDVIHRDFTFQAHTKAWLDALVRLGELGEAEAAKFNQLGLNPEALRAAPPSGQVPTPPAQQPTQPSEAPKPPTVKQTEQPPAVPMVALVVVLALLAAGIALIGFYAFKQRRAK